MSRCEDLAIRRAWRKRIEDHDGGVEEGGGIRRWLKLAEAVGLDPDFVASNRGVLPSTRFACDAYMRFVRDMPMLDAVAASLTELFPPAIHRDRIAGLIGMAYRITYHQQAEAELDALYADIVTTSGDRIAGEFVDGVITLMAFSVRGDDVLTLGVFARGRDITEGILEERIQ